MPFIALIQQSSISTIYTNDKPNKSFINAGYISIMFKNKRGGFKMEIKKNLEQMFLHSIMLGLSGTTLITSIKGISWILDNPLYAETYSMFLGFTIMLGLSLFMLLISAFQVIALSVKKQEVDKNGNENKQPVAETSVKNNREAPGISG